MAVPKKKTSHMKQAQRRAANWKLKAPALVECPQCRSSRLPHHVCPTCGFYDGREVIKHEVAETK